MENKLIKPAVSSRHALVGPADLWEAKRRFQIDFLLEAGLKPHHKLLDFGCGTLRGGLPLIEYLDPGHYYGLDVRIETLKEACNELEESGMDHKKPTLIHCHDLSSLVFVGGFDFIWAFSVLIHLSDIRLEEFLSFAARNLCSEGKIYANVNYGQKPDGFGRFFPVIFRQQNFYTNTFRRHGFEINDMGPLREFGHKAHPRSEEEELSQRIVKAFFLPDQQLVEK